MIDVQTVQRKKKCTRKEKEVVSPGNDSVE